VAAKKSEIEKITDFLKKNWAYIILLGIFLFGLHLRSYHLDYPVIGYHNWKETHYLTEARNFAREGFFEHGFFIPYRDFWTINSDDLGVHGDTFPTVSILVGLGFKLFGNKLIVARLIGFFLNSLIIILIYLILKKLTNNEFVSLTGAFLTAINPLFTFFSHNVQLMNVGIFFSMLSLYLFLVWIDHGKGKFLILATICLTISVLTKYPFMIVVGSLMFLFPYKRLKLKNLKKNYKSYLISIIILLLIPLWMIYSGKVATEYGLSSSAVDVGAIQFDKIFTKQFWNTSKAYTADNFTLNGFTFIVLGVVLLLTMGIRKSNKLSKFLLGYFISFLVFFFVMGLKLSGHSYHYFPVAPLGIMLITYSFIVIINTASGIIKSFLKIKHLDKIVKIVVLIILLSTIYAPSIKARNRQFDTQFLGLDVAGEYLLTRTAPGERIMHSSHQAYGVLWHGDVKGTRGIPGKVEDIIYAEEELNIQWIFMYNWDFNLLQGEVGQHIKENYHLAQVGLQQNNQQTIPIYFIFKKGGNFSEEQLNTFINSHPVQTKEYEYTFGKVPFLFASE